MSNFIASRRKFLGLADGPSDTTPLIYDASGNPVQMVPMGTGENQYMVYPPEIFVNIDNGDSTQHYLAPGYTSSNIPTYQPLEIVDSPLEIVSQFSNTTGPSASAPAQGQFIPSVIYGPPAPDYALPITTQPPTPAGPSSAAPAPPTPAGPSSAAPAPPPAPLVDAVPGPVVTETLPYVPSGATSPIYQSIYYGETTGPAALADVTETEQPKSKLPLILLVAVALFAS